MKKRQNRKKNEKRKIEENFVFFSLFFPFFSCYFCYQRIYKISQGSRRVTVFFCYIFCKCCRNFQVLHSKIQYPAVFGKKHFFWLSSENIIGQPQIILFQGSGHQILVHQIVSPKQQIFRYEILSSRILCQKKLDIPKSKLRIRLERHYPSAVLTSNIKKLLYQQKKYTPTKKQFCKLM